MRLEADLSSKISAVQTDLDNYKTHIQTLNQGQLAWTILYHPRLTRSDMILRKKE